MFVASAKLYSSACLQQWLGMNARSRHEVQPPYGLLARGAIGGLFFGTAWGGWAYYCNLKFGKPKAIDAALTQFAFSFIVTLFFSLTVDTLYDNSKTLLGKWVFAVVLPVACMLGGLVLLHSLRGTPNIFLTVLPSTSIAAMYCLWKIAHGAWFVNRKLQRVELAGQSKTIRQ